MILSKDKMKILMSFKYYENKMDRLTELNNFVFAEGNVISTLWYKLWWIIIAKI